MNIVFRVDSSNRIGSGHVMRCLTLADRLVQESANIRFICRDHPGNMSQMIRERGYPVDMIPMREELSKPKQEYTHSDWLGVSLEHDSSQTLDILRQIGRIDWLIVDHYAIDSLWENQMRTIVRNLFVIDDLSDRPHDCDILLDQNMTEYNTNRYCDLVSEECLLLFGPQYALLRPQFLRSEYRERERTGVVRKIMVFFGGVDATGETLKTCRAITSLNNSSFNVDVIAPSANPQQQEIIALCNEHPQLVHYGYVGNMAEMMSQADLAIGAGGTTTWERAWLGLPTIIVVIAQNQMEGAKAMDACGGAWNMGHYADVTESTMRSAIQYAISEPSEISAMSKAAKQVFGRETIPGIDLVVNAMLERQYART